MTFLEQINAVLTDRFAEGKRAEAKRWFNARYGRIWGLEPWTFKQGVQDLNVSAGASTASMGTMQRIVELRDSSSNAVTYTTMDRLRPESFYEQARRDTGIPTGLTVINNVIYFDHPLATARTFKVLGELKFVELSGDTEVSLLPPEFHMTPVYGAISDGLRLENDPTWQGAEQDFQAQVTDMRKTYLTQIYQPDNVAPSWP